MQLARNKSHSPRRYYFGNKNGSFFLILLPFLFLFSLSIFELIYLIRKSQNNIALRYRLQVCAISILESHKQTLHKIIRIQKLMLPLQYIIYAARNAKFFPPIALPSNISETLALSSIRALDLQRKALIFQQILKDARSLSCQETPYSNSNAYCIWTPFSPKNFTNKPVLYPDIPPLYLYTKSNTPIYCTSSKLFPEKMELFLRGDSSLEQENFAYHYGNASQRFETKNE